MTSVSPLGRYSGAADDTTLHEVRLLRLPLRLLVAGREHHDDLMREFALMALSPGSRSVLPARLTDLVEILGVRYGAATARPSAEVDRALQRGDETVDLTYTVPAHVVEDAARLNALMREADEFCTSEQLLTVCRSPVVVAFSEWYLEEFQRQVAGEPPRPWDGPLTV